MHDLAAELQAVTTFGDEATISAMAMLQQLGDLNEQGLKQITPLLQDFAAAMRVDLNTAATLIGKTLGSTTNALSRYGIELDAMAPKSEKLAQLTEALEEKFGGAAIAMGQTTLGAIKSLNNAMGDLKEEGGRAAAEGLKPVVKWLTGVFTSATNAAKQLRLVNEALAGTGLQSDLAQMQATLKALQDQYGEYDKGLRRVSGTQFRTKEEALAALQAQIDEQTNLISWTEKVAQATAKGNQEARIAAEQEAAIAQGKIDFRKKLAAAWAATPEGIKAALEATLQYWEQGVLPFLDEGERMVQVLDVIAGFRERMAESGGVGEEEAEAQHQNTLLEIVERRFEREKELRKRFEKWKKGNLEKEIEDAAEAAEKLEDKIKSWLQPLSTFSNQATMALGTLAVLGEEGMEAFENSMKSAFAAMLEGLGQIFAVEALGAWAAVFGGRVDQIGAAVGYSAAATAAFLGAGIVRALAHGGDFMTSGPELVMVGDNPGGVERVQVDPVSSRGQADEMPVHIQVILSEGPIIDTVARASRNRTLVLDARSLTTR